MENITDAQDNETIEMDRETYITESAATVESMNTLDGSIKNKKCRLENKIRGCECSPEYIAAQTWKDGRIRLSTSCEVPSNLMLDPDGTFRVRVYKDLSYLPAEVRKEKRQEIQKEMVEVYEKRMGCKLLWDGKTYTFNGCY